jgi:penicillin-binding protein 2
MGLFFRQKKQSIFVIQQDGALGDVPTLRENEAFEDAFGEFSRSQTVSGRRFLGLTISRGRFRILAIIVTSLIFLLSARAAYLQILQGEHYAALAEGNRNRNYTIVPPRGIVYDRNGELLIENISTFALTMTIADLPTDDTERDELLNRTANLAGINRTDLDLLISEYALSPFDPVPVKRGIPYENAMRLAIESATLPGFTLEASSTRRYSSAAPSLSHVLGYMGSINETEYEEWKDRSYRRVDQIGKTGIERSAEEILRGTPGNLVVEVDAIGNELAIASKEDPVAGANITLSIDLPLQKFIETQLDAVLEKTETSRAAVVAMDPQTGAVRALVSIPTFDSNDFADGIDIEEYERLRSDENNPLFPRAIAGNFPSGSTFKPFVAYAALAEGIITENTSFLSTGGIRISQWYFPDWRAGGHGITNVKKALADSVNTFFYIIGGGYQDLTGLGVERITEYASRFGFGAKTGIDLPGEAEGFLPSKEWKQEVKGEQWYVGDTYHLAIGQGDLLATPIQLATALSAIANGGRAVTPYLIDAIDGPGGKVVTNDIDGTEQTFDPEITQIIREGMRQTITSGSGRYIDSLPIDVAGKTGTAQTPGDRPTHAWFIGFAPYENPSLAIVVLIEEGGEGSSVAVPLARDIFEWWYLFGDAPSN